MVASACGRVTIRARAKQQFPPVADVNGSFCRESRIAFPSDIFCLRDTICISIELSGNRFVSLNLISSINFLSFHREFARRLIQVEAIAKIIAHSCRREITNREKKKNLTETNNSSGLERSVC
jgi:hypothetical protein